MALHYVQAASLRALAEILDTSNIGHISAFAISLDESDFPYAVVDALKELKRVISTFSTD